MILSQVLGYVARKVSFLEAISDLFEEAPIVNLGVPSRQIVSIDAKWTKATLYPESGPESNLSTISTLLCHVNTTTVATSS